MWKDLASVKKNEWSIPRTVSCLSNINDIKHLDTAADLITNYKRTGYIFINLTGNNGLNLFKSLPNRLKHRLIFAFKRSPKTIIGVTKTHLIIHSIKVLEKYELVAFAVPFIAIALILSCLPVWLPWMLLIGSSGYLILALTHKFKYKLWMKSFSTKAYYLLRIWSNRQVMPMDCRLETMPQNYPPELIWNLPASFLI